MYGICGLLNLVFAIEAQSIWMNILLGFIGVGMWGMVVLLMIQLFGLIRLAIKG